MQDGITHSNGGDKGSVYFDWTAPAAGSGSLRFGYTIIQCHTIGRQAGRQFQLRAKAYLQLANLGDNINSIACACAGIINY